MYNGVMQLFKEKLKFSEQYPHISMQIYLLLLCIQAPTPLVCLPVRFFLAMGYVLADVCKKGKVFK